MALSSFWIKLGINSGDYWFFECPIALEISQAPWSTWICRMLKNITSSPMFIYIWKYYFLPGIEHKANDVEQISLISSTPTLKCEPTWSTSVEAL